MKEKDGGPAFPRSGSSAVPQGGMTLRDYFAGQALAGELACQSGDSDGIGWYSDLDPECMVHFAQRCYRIADAMLAERERRHE